MMRTAQLHGFLVALILGSGLVSSGNATQSPVAAADAIDELWIEPHDLEQRDLYRGPSAAPGPPPEGTTFTFVEKDTSGRSPGYDVRDASGRPWSVKLGPEAQSEVVSSRILWAIGFHQPPSYHVERWALTDSAGEDLEDDRTFGGRFRPDVDGWQVVEDRWAWNDNPHMSWQPHAGLLVAQMILNNWDLKDSNNKVYEVSDGSSGPRRRYVVRDLGASLGSNEQAPWVRWTNLRFKQGSKNDLEGFLESGFIEGVDDGRVRFAYSGPNKPYVANITPADVRWTARLLSRLSDRQWHDAFRAGGYGEADSARFIARLKEKVAMGVGVR